MVLAALVGWWLLFAPWIWWEPGKDARGYLSMAWSLAREGRLLLYGDPSLHYGFGYSVVLTPAFWLGADSPWPWMAVLHTAVASLWMLLIYRWAKRLVSPRSALVTAVLCSVMFAAVHYHRQVLSDFVFVTLFLLACVAMPTLTQAGGKRWGGYALAGLGVMGAVLTRQAGVVLAAGAGMAAMHAWWASGRGGLAKQPGSGESGVWRARGAVIWSGVFAGLPALLAFGFQKSRQQGRSEDLPTYTDQILRPIPEDVERAGGMFEPMSRFEQVNTGVYCRVEEFGRMLLPGGQGLHSDPANWLHPMQLIYLPLAVWLLVGWWRLLRRSGDVYLWTLPFYVALHVIWPYQQGTRYMLPMLPMAVLVLVANLHGGTRRRWPVMAALVLAHAGFTVGKIASEWPEARARHRLGLEVRELLEPTPLFRETIDATWLTDPEHGPVLGQWTRDDVLQSRAVNGWLSFWSDRFWEPWRGKAKLPSHAIWVVRMADEPRPAGYRVVAEHPEGWVLLQRDGFED